MPQATPFTFFQYAACSTCRKAKRWLDDHGVAHRSIPIVESPPALAELARLVEQSGVAVERWFNTSGQSYRALIARMGKREFAALPAPQKLALLAADGKMIKRPVLVAGSRVLVGFDESRYASLL
jgi:arsenate reductase